MDYELPTEFDLIVVGTGMVESIISAAASRIGKRVLHLDSNNYYGGLFASFNLESFQNLHITEDDFKTHIDIKDGEEFVKFGNNSFKLKNVSNKWHVPEATEPEIVEKIEETNEQPAETIEEETKPKVWTKTALLEVSRKFNIDLHPKIQYARGEFVELLISSNTARYSEYRSVSRVLTWLNNQIEIVPCSRSDIFANNKVSLVEKRMLMKFLSSLDESTLKDNEEKTFKSFLIEKKLTKNLVHYILYAISNSSDTTSCKDGVENTKKFIKSLGRFGKTPFMYSMFGSSDLIQEFCRLSAVFGGVYVLGPYFDGFIIENKKFKSLVFGKQQITAENIVIGLELAPEAYVKSFKKRYSSRAVLVTNKSILNCEQDPVSLLFYPPESGKNPCTVIELPYPTSCCPKDTYLVHISAEESTTPEEDLKDCINNLFDFESEENSKPKILFSSYFSIPLVDEVDLNDDILSESGVWLTPGPDTDLDFDLAVLKAKEIFNKIYKDPEFLPRAPDPEEIKFDGDDDEVKDKTEDEIIADKHENETIADKNEDEIIAEKNEE